MATESIENKDVAINLELLKQLRFYHIFDPNGKKLFGRNLYWFIFLVSNIIYQCLLIYGNLGFLVNMEDTVDEANFFILLAVYSGCYLQAWKMFIFLYKPKMVWDVFEIAQINCLKSKPCIKHYNIMYLSRKRTLKITNIWFLCSLIIYIQWITPPLLSYLIRVPNNSNVRLWNILNLRFPVNIKFYNQNYVVFYVLEMVIMSYSIYLTIIFDTYFISFCRVIVAQYRTITHAFATFGHEVDTQSDIIVTSTKYYEHLKNILFDQLQLFLKTKLYYSLVWIIVINIVLFTAIIIIVLEYVFMRILSSPDLYSVFSIMKLGTSVIFFMIQLFLYCYSFNNIKDEIINVNFGIYSCNWTMMDIKLKKLVLTTMRMNDVNQLMMKISPEKLIDLEFFCSTMIRCYNIVSVMYKTINKKK